MQWFYFLAIHRLAIGVALLIEYLAPLLVALWARFVYHEPVRRRIWGALALALAGLATIVNVFGGGAERPELREPLRRQPRREDGLRDRSVHAPQQCGRRRQQIAEPRVPNGRGLNRERRLAHLHSVRNGT